MRNRHSRGLRAGPLPILESALGEWLELMEEDRRWGKKDAPWWYNERALLSLFAGAIWKSEGWVFEEYTTSKGKEQEHRKKRQRFSGRGDIEFHIGRQKFQGEAKPCYPSLTRGLEDPVNQIQETLSEACRDVRQLPHYRRYRRVGIVFASPCLVETRSEICQVRIKAFAQYLEEFEGAARAWTFPPKGAHLRAGDYIYPGAAILIRPLG